MGQPVSFECDAGLDGLTPTPFFADPPTRRTTISPMAGINQTPMSERYSKLTAANHMNKRFACERVCENGAVAVGGGGGFIVTRRDLFAPAWYGILLPRDSCVIGTTGHRESIRENSRKYISS